MTKRNRQYHQEYTLEYDQDGRICAGSCGRKKSWMEFHLKPKGINGRNSQCKSCTAITRKRIRKSEKYKKKLLAQAQLETIVIGNLDEDTISDFGSLFAKGIVGLIEQGQI